MRRLYIKLSSQRQWLYWGALAALVVVFATVAALQYRWNREIANADSVRMQAALDASIIGFREDLYREFSTVALAFDTDSKLPFDAVLSAYASRFRSWQRAATHPDLVSGVFVWHTGPHEDTLARLTPGQTGFTPVTWPEELLATRDRLSGLTVVVNRAFPFGAGVHAFPTTENNGFRGAWAPPTPPWFINEDVPALINRARDSDPGSATVSWIIVVLDRHILSTHIISELAQRHFSERRGREYRLAVTNGGGPGDIAFSTDGEFFKERNFHADAISPLFGPFRILRVGGLGHGEAPPLPPTNTADQRVGETPWMFRLVSLPDNSGEHGWRLVAQHRDGSVERAVRRLQRRNLLISFAILAVLVITTGLLFVASQRAHRLARLQLDFIAGVSHELRTPLTVILSAADNIADGVVENKHQVTRYGRVIKGQTRQLIELVEQVLAFVSARQTHARYHVRQVDVTDVVAGAIRSTAESVAVAGFHLEYAAEPYLPKVAVDATALTHVLQNLISNAVKYGGEAHWIGITVVCGPVSGRSCVRIHVSDRGVGISSSELRRIFDPFYRGEAAAAAQIHGTGLGLAVARNITEALGGRLTVTSKPGVGSTFTVTLPSAADASDFQFQPTVAASQMIRSGR